MKQFVIVLLFGLVSLSVQKGGGIMKYAKECMEETNANAKDLAKFMKNEEITDQNSKCFFQCTMKKDGSMDDSGNVNLQKLKDMMPKWGDKAKFDGIVAECEKMKGSDNCDTAYQVAKCVKTKLWPKNEMGC